MQPRLGTVLAKWPRMPSLLEKVASAVAVLRDWKSTEVSAAVDAAIGSYEAFAATIQRDPEVLEGLDPEARGELLLEMAEIAAAQIARLAREAPPGSLGTKAAISFQAAFGPIMRAAGRDLGAQEER